MTDLIYNANIGLCVLTVSVIPMVHPHGELWSFIIQAAMPGSNDMVGGEAKMGNQWLSVMTSIPPIGQRQTSTQRYFIFSKKFKHKQTCLKIAYVTTPNINRWLVLWEIVCPFIKRTNSSATQRSHQSVKLYGKSHVFSCIQQFQIMWRENLASSILQKLYASVKCS